MGFSIWLIVFMNKDSFYSSFPILMFLFIFLALLYSLGSPVLYGIEEEIAYMIVLYLILGESIQYLIARKLTMVQYY